MNVIEAVRRLDILNNGIRALDYAIDEANRRADIEGRHALRTILSEVVDEKDSLEKKLTEVQL